jgi:6 kDa early secretory antigenic target
MSDQSFSIDPVAVMQAHGEIDSAAGKIMGLLTEVEGDGKILLSTWEGDAHQAYVARQQQWHADAEVIVQKLQQINQGLERAVQLYSHADRRGVELITGGNA